MSRLTAALVATACLSSLGLTTPVSLAPALVTAPPATLPMAAAIKSQSQAFVPNLGQWDAQAQFLARSPGANVWVTDTGVVYDFHRFVPDKDAAKDPMEKFETPKGRTQGHVVRMEFAGGLPSAVTGKEKLEGYHNYFLGNDESRWASNVPRFAEATSERVYDGISARWYFDQGAPRYDLIVEPGADPSQIAMRFEGADGVSTDGRTLRLQTSLGVVEHNGLFAYQKVGNKTRQVEASFVVSGNSASFRLGSYDRSKPLVIDPLVWSTFLGGTSADFATSAVVDSADNVVLAGYAQSTDFPVGSGAYDEIYNGGGYDTFVSKLSAGGSTLLFSTFLGGSVDDIARSVALDASGNPVVVGQSSSTNFPATSGAFDQTHTGGTYDAYVAKLSADGASLIYATYLGGASTENAHSVAVDASGNAIVTGYTADIFFGGFPTTAGAYDQTHNGSNDAFVAKVSSDGSSLVYSTLLGGVLTDSANSVTLDASGGAVVVGETASTGFPTTASAYDQTHNGNLDVFVTRLSPDGSSLVYSTLLGGTLTETAKDVALDASGGVVVVGRTDSIAFPTTAGAYDQTNIGGVDAFMARLASDGSSLVYSTFLGGAYYEEARSVALDASGGAVVAGYTSSTDFPMTTGAYDISYNGGSVDTYVSKLSPDGSSLVYSTFLGGTGFDDAFAVALDASGIAVVAGQANWGDFPTTAGAYDQAHNGGYDAFVAKLVVSAPTASNNSYGVNAGSTVNISAPGVLGNDTGSPTAAVLTQSPTQATTFSLNSDGSFSYTPNAGFTGVDTFKYKAQNALGLSNEATVTLNVRAVLSSLTIDQSPIPGGVSITGTVTLTTPAKPGGQTVYFSDGQTWFLAEGYTVTVPGGSSSAPFTINTTPPPYSVTGKVYCTLANGSGISKNASVTVKPLPKAVNDTYKLNANGNLNVSAPGVLTNDINLLGGTAVLVSGPSNASSFALNANGSFSYTPNTGFIGDDTFTYKCQNAGGTGTIVATVTITARAVLASMTNLNNPVTGGNNLTGTVTLVGNAPVGGVTVYFTDTLAALNTTGYTVVVPFGSSSANFSIPTTAVGAPQSGGLTATLSNGSGINKTKTVNINP